MLQCRAWSGRQASHNLCLLRGATLQSCLGQWMQQRIKQPHLPPAACMATTVSPNFPQAPIQASQTDTHAAPDASDALQDVLRQLSTSPLMPQQRPVLAVISGPSGVGKDAVIKRLQQARPDLHFVVTATSRPQRPGEQEGVDYTFVSKQQFEAWMHAGELLEHAVVYGEYKGIPKQQVYQALARGTDVVLRIDVQGAQTVRRLMPQAISIFMVAESEQKLGQRLVDRKTEAPDKLLTRLQTARLELSHIEDFDYVIVNADGQLDRAVAQLSAIIDAERCKVPQRSGVGQRQALQS